MSSGLSGFFPANALTASPRSNKRPFSAMSSSSSSRTPTAKQRPKTPFSTARARRRPLHSQKFNTISTTTPVTRKTYSRVTVNASSEHIKVVIRQRPPKQSSSSSVPPESCVELLNDTELKCLTTSRRTKHGVIQDFQFDKVFGPDSNEQDLMECCGLPVVERLLEGHHGSILAYGQTGSGKTFTMTQMIKLVLQDLFQKIENSSAIVTNQFEVSCSYLQVYNERISDLLVVNDTSSNLRLRDRGDGSLRVENLTEQVVANSVDALALVQDGDSRRTVAATNMNEESSRSHAVFTITLTMTVENKKRVSRLHLVDLAGSESQKTSHAEGKRLKEAAQINKSLSALRNVINALVSKQTSHVPYRDSKLTRILELALGGKGYSCLIATIAPEISNMAETQSTLKFAQRARQVSNVIVTEELVDITPAQSARNILASPAGSAASDANSARMLHAQREMMMLKASLKQAQTKEKQYHETFKQLESGVLELCRENKRVVHIATTQQQLTATQASAWDTQRQQLQTQILELQAQLTEAKAQAQTAAQEAADAKSAMMQARQEEEEVAATVSSPSLRPRSDSGVEVDNSGCLILSELQPTDENHGKDDDEEEEVNDDQHEEALPAPKKRKTALKRFIHKIKKRLKTPKNKNKKASKNDENATPVVDDVSVADAKIQMPLEKKIVSPPSQPTAGRKYNLRKRKQSTGDDYVHFSFR